MQYTAPIVESKLDWLTLTACTPERRERLFRFASDLLLAAQTPTLPNKPWRWKGYDGLHRQGITAGRRPDSDILQLSGPMADQWFDTAWAYADHCTRADICVTVGEVKDCDAILGTHETEQIAWHIAHPTGAGCNTITHNGRRETLYVGSRQSDLFGRIYDKHAESSDDAYRECLRYELEVKGDPAQRLAVRLAACANRADTIRDAVHRYFQRRGIGPVYGNLGEGLPVNHIRPRTDRESRLAWLANSVRPVVGTLVALGDGPAVCEALGLPLSLTERARLRASAEVGTHRDELQDDTDDKPGDTD